MKSIKYKILINFCLIATVSIVLIGLSVPANSGARGAWLADEGDRVTLALTLMPFAGIAFLWFMGVVRDRLGAFEDQLFSTVFFGSGLLFLAMIFAAAAVTDWDRERVCRRCTQLADLLVH